MSCCHLTLPFVLIFLFLWHVISFFCVFFSTLFFSLSEVFQLEFCMSLSHCSTTNNEKGITSSWTYRAEKTDNTFHVGVSYISSWTKYIVNGKWRKQKQKKQKKTVKRVQNDWTITWAFYFEIRKHLNNKSCVDCLVQRHWNNFAVHLKLNQNEKACA